MQELNLNYDIDLYSISEKIEPLLNTSINEDLIINYSFDFTVYCYNTHSKYKFNVYCNEWDINIYCDNNTEDITQLIELFKDNDYILTNMLFEHKKGENFNFNENIKITLEKTEIHILNYERRDKK